MSTTDIDIVVIGAGVVGLACAAELAQSRSVCLLERHDRPGLECSTHNSGVIHAGIYYPKDSLKAKLCVEGRERLYAFCESNGVPHQRCGKLIVAPAEEAPRIEALHKRAAANGVEALEIYDAAAIRRREPHVAAGVALWSGTTGIVEAESLVKALRRRCADLGVAILTGAPAQGADRENGRLVVRTPFESIAARTVVNCAGLYADEVSALFGGTPFRIYPVRGEYAELVPARRHLVSTLIYPLPPASGHGLGVHVTRSTWGAVLLGPTAAYKERKDDYESNRLAVEDFLEPTQALLPEVRLEDLRLAGTGIRAKLSPPEVSFADFMIGRDELVPDLVQVSGIDSPGLTSCLAIARHVGEIVAAD
jgi:L-2-hydroxyglutarate oxidase LhgO